jgi:Serine dehydrogenase proteinase
MSAIKKFTASPFVTVEKEVGQTHDRRKGLIKKLEDYYQAKVITLFTSFRRPDVQIEDMDAEMLESVLAAEHKAGDKILLIINSPGGQALAAERIANVCRAYSNNKFEVIVPHMAKSAATMVCFGAKKIHMSKTAELGPVDPQVPFWPDTVSEPTSENAIWISAEEYIRSYEQLISQSASGKAKRIEPFIQQLNRYDSRYIERLRSVQQLSTDISIRLLKSLMMSGKSIANIKKGIEVFTSQKKLNSHGRMINHSEAKDCGLNIEVVDLQSAHWHLIWEIYVRADYAVSMRCSKLIETAETGLNG